MEDYILNLIINFLLMIFAVYSIKELIYDNKISNKFLNRIKKEGWFLIFISLLSVFFNFIRDKNSEDKQDKISREKATTDSLLQKKQEELKNLQIKTKDTILIAVEKTYNKSIETTNKALANYNLEITDSLTTVINTVKINHINPQLRIAPLSKNNPFAYIKKENDEDILCIKFNSVEGTCYNIKLRGYFIDRQNNKIPSFGDITYGKDFLTQNVDRTYSIGITESLKNYKNLLVLITGTFTKDPEGQSIIPFNTAFEFNFDKNELIGIIQVDYDNLKTELNIK